MLKSNRSKALDHIIVANVAAVFLLLVLPRKLPPQYGFFGFGAVAIVAVLYSAFILHRFGLLHREAKAYIFNRFMFGVFVASGAVGMVFMTIVLIGVL